MQVKKCVRGLCSRTSEMDRGMARRNSSRPWAYYESSHSLSKKSPSSVVMTTWTLRTRDKAYFLFCFLLNTWWLAHKWITHSHASIKVWFVTKLMWIIFLILCKINILKLKVVMWVMSHFNTSVILQWTLRKSSCHYHQPGTEETDAGKGPNQGSGCRYLGMWPLCTGTWPVAHSRLNRRQWLRILERGSIMPYSLFVGICCTIL